MIINYIILTKVGIILNNIANSLGLWGVACETNNIIANMLQYTTTCKLSILI